MAVEVALALICAGVLSIPLIIYVAAKSLQ